MHAVKRKKDRTTKFTNPAIFSLIIHAFGDRQIVLRISLIQRSYSLIIKVARKKGHTPNSLIHRSYSLVIQAAREIKIARRNSLIQRSYSLIICIIHAGEKKRSRAGILHGVRERQIERRNSLNRQSDVKDKKMTINSHAEIH